MARPKKGEEKVRPIHLGFRVAEWVHGGLGHLAESDGVPVSDLANDALVAYLKRRGIVDDAKKELVKKKGGRK
jgi:hypothetical protein